MQPKNNKQNNNTMSIMPLRKLLSVTVNAFYIRRTPDVPDMVDLLEQIRSLDFDDISKGKENLRGDSMKLRNDFMKATMEAKRKLQYEGCLL